MNINGKVFVYVRFFLYMIINNKCIEKIGKRVEYCKRGN